MYTLFLFLISSVLLTLSPGPDLLLVMSLGLQRSFGQVVVFILGLCSGLLIHTLLLTMGWQQFLSEYPKAIDVFKLLGAVYFALLALQVFRSNKNSQTTTNIVFSDGFSLWKKGVLMNVLNPKVGLFFWLFFPGFLFSENWSVGEQYLILGALFSLQAFGVMTFMGFLASKIKKHWFSEDAFSAVLFRYFTAGVLAILALYLGVS